MKVVKHGKTNFMAERIKHVETAVLNIQAGNGSIAIAAALLALETQFGRTTDILNRFLQLAENEDI